MKTFTINNRVYKALEPDFNFVADYGDSLNNPTKAARAYLAFCGRMSEEQAGHELNSHIISGNDLEEISSVLIEEIENSGFFQALNKSKETEVTTSATKKAKKE